ncbi:MAG TPA: hypothetical protein VKR59_19830 [Terriglobales bacterium]|nr:hypothetical protein [Terriglobales bacterium]
MNNCTEWRKLHQAAMLELRPEHLPLRIDEAERAILRRVAEIKTDDSDSTEESRELTDALRGLRFLASTECKSPLSVSSSSGPTRSEASS